MLTLELLRKTRETVGLSNSDIVVRVKSFKNSQKLKRCGFTVPQYR